MSDNPSGDGSELIDFGINVDQTGFQQTEKLINRLEEELHRLETTVLGLGNVTTNEFIQFSDEIDKLSKAVNEPNMQFDVMQGRVEKLAGAFRELSPELEKIVSEYTDLKNVQESTNRVGSFSSEAPEGGLSGSPYGVARGVRGAADIARLAGIDQAVTSGLVGGADVLYVVQGLDQLEKVFGPLNQSLEASGGLIPPITNGLVGLGIPMAGLLTTVAPMAAAVALIVVEFNNLQRTIEAGTAAIENADKQLVEHFKLAADGTTEEITKKREAAQADADAYKNTIGINRDELNRQIEAAGRNAGLSDGNISSLQALAQNQANAPDKQASEDFLNQWKIAGLDLGAAYTPINTLIQATQKLEIEAGKAQINVDAASSALGTASVAANDAAIASRAFAETGIDIAKQYAADDKLTAEAAKERIAALELDAESRRKAIEQIKLGDQASGLSAEQHRLNAEAIQQHTVAIINDTDEIAHINQESMPLIQWRKYEADAIAGQTEAMKQHATYLEQVNKLMSTGSSDQVSSYRTQLQGRLGTAENALDALSGQGTPLTSAQLSEWEKLRAIAAEIKRELDDIDQNIAPLVAARDAFKEIGDAIADFAKKKQTLEDNLALASAAARERERNAEQQYTEGSLQDVHERERIHTEASRKEIEIRQQTADKIIDIENQKNYKNVDSATQLARQNEDDQGKYQDNYQKLIRKSQYDAEDLEVEHRKRLSEIRTRDDADQIIALQNRNFLAFFQSQLKGSSAVTEEEQSYTESHQKLTVHLKRQQDELGIALNQEQKQRLVDYQRRFDDAQLWAQRQEFQAQQHEDRKLQTLRASETQQINDLAAMQTYKIQLLQQGLANELALLQAQEQAKLNLLSNTQAAIIQQSLQQLGAIAQNNPYAAFAGAVSSPLGQNLLGAGLNAVGSFLGNLPFLDDGGDFNAGEMLSKGDISEVFDFGGAGAYSIPGAAMVYPLQGGTATPQSSGGKRSISIQNLYITEAENAQATAHAVLDMLEGIDG